MVLTSELEPSLLAPCPLQGPPHPEPVRTEIDSLEATDPLVTPPPGKASWSALGQQGAPSTFTLSCHHAGPGASTRSFVCTLALPSEAEKVSWERRGGQDSHGSHFTVSTPASPLLRPASVEGNQVPGGAVSAATGLCSSAAVSLSAGDSGCGSPVSVSLFLLFLPSSCWWVWMNLLIPLTCLGEQFPATSQKLKNRCECLNNSGTARIEAKRMPNGLSGQVI